METKKIIFCSTTICNIMYSNHSDSLDIKHSLLYFVLIILDYKINQTYLFSAKMCQP